MTDPILLHPTMTMLMTPGRPLVTLAALALLSGCAGHPHRLGTIEPIAGSLTREGGEIVPLGSDSAKEIKPLHGVTREIAPLDTTPEREIKPLRGQGREIAPLDTTREIAPRGGVAAAVEGSTWTGTSLDGATTFEFLAGGILRYTTDNGTWTNGTWQQESGTITFEMNSHYADYTGRIRGTHMSGTGHNRAGREWDWQATRQ